MSGDAVWAMLWARGVEVSLHGRRLRAQVRNGTTLAPEDAEIVRRHAHALAGSLRARAGREPTTPVARPNLHDLAARFRARFGGSLQSDYARVTGVDLGSRNPDWPDLEAFEVWLRSQDPGDCRRCPPSLTPRSDFGLFSLRLKSQLDLTVEEFAEVCTRAIGRPGIASAEDDDAVAAVLLDMIDDAQAERERCEERAAILEHDAGFSREEAEARAGLAETSS